MAQLKDEISPTLVRTLADELSTAWDGFPRAAFVTAATAGLDDLELLQRVDHIAAALAQVMPDAFVESAAVLEGALGSPTFDGWMVLPCSTYAAQRGIDDPDRALPLLAALTPRFTSEWPIRAFIDRYPDRTLELMRSWTEDPDEHVRRLVSEGTRPRLPWAARLRRFVDDPTPTIELLDRLVDDPSAYVRRSVANHLNDISKDHPQLALATARRWLAAGGEHTRATVRHGLRTAIKRGDPDALRLLGHDPDVAVDLRDLDVSPRRVPIGEQVTIRFTLVADESVPVVVDYVVHHAGARGVRAPKVFKLAERLLSAGEPAVIERRHRFATRSVRQLHPGPHRVEVQVNGRVLGGVDLELELAGLPGGVPG